MVRSRLLATLMAIVFGSAAAADPLRLEDLERRILPSAASSERRAELANLDAELISSGGALLDGATLGFGAGPRLADAEATRADAELRLELPLSAARREHERLVEIIDSGRIVVLDAEARAARLLLRASFFDAWYLQERLGVADLQIADTERLVAATRRRVESGDQAPHEAALVEGDLVRLLGEADAMRRERSAAWAGLRAIVELPPDPQPLAASPVPSLDALANRHPGVVATDAVKAAVARRSIGEALADYEIARRRSRWSLGFDVAREGTESVAKVGGAYRLPRRGESAAWARERNAARDFARRSAEIEESALASRLSSALERARRFGPVVDPASFDGAIRAVSLRLESGKDGPAAAIPVRRQLMEARAAALARVRDALALGAEIEFLVAGVEP